MTYIFDHLFKTAGTTFHSSYLPAAFPSHQRFVVRGSLRDNAEDLKFLQELPSEKKQRFRVIAGHHTGFLRAAFPHARYLTLVRDPVDRVVSAYLHARFDPAAQDLAGRYLRENSIGLAEFVQRDLFSQLVDQYVRDRKIALPGFMGNDQFARTYADFVSVHNRQARTLLGTDLRSIASSDSTSLMAAIRERFFLVGCSEQFERFLFFLHRSEGFPLVLFNNRLVRREKRDFQLQQEDRDTILRFNAVDSALYRLVQEEFNRSVATFWNAGCDEIYGKYQQALEQFRMETGRNENMTELFKY